MRNGWCCDDGRSRKKYFLTFVALVAFSVFGLFQSPTTLSNLWNNNNNAYTSTTGKGPDQAVVPQNQVDTTSNNVKEIPPPTPANSSLPVCLIPPFYGRLNNQIISIARALKEARLKSTKLVVGLGWDDVYSQTFDPHPDILLLPKTDLPLPPEKCLIQLTGGNAFYLHGGPQSKNNHFLIELTELLPLQETRQEAMDVIATDYHNQSFISVHRRWLENSCYKRSRKRENFGSVKSCTAKEQIKTCNVKFSDISNPNNRTVILFTDGQAPSMDKTFPIRDQRKFNVQMWMMAQSETHYGNPASSVDWVVMHWRQRLGKGNMEPAACYPKVNNDKT